jgi:hypothetical protein
MLRARKMVGIVLACMSGLGLTVACGGSDRVPGTVGASEAAAHGSEVNEVIAWSRVSVDSLGSGQEVQKRRAQDAAQAMGGRLLGELEAALDESGPVGAIAVCQDRAPVIGRQTGEEHGVAIGRTSFRLRNPSNTPPEWAMPYVDERVDEKVFVASSDGRLGALLPIHLKAPCTMCHGPAGQIAGEVQAAVAEHYPEDSATGFEEGDLRGWFWVEVPAQEM